MSEIFDCKKTDNTLVQRGIGTWRRGHGQTTGSMRFLDGQQVYAEQGRSTTPTVLSAE